MESLARYGDVIGAIGFGAAMLGLIATPAERHGTFVRGFKWTVAAFILIYLLITGLDAIGEAHLLGVFDLYEDFAQTLPAVLALGAVFVLYSTQQYRDVARAHRALEQSHDLMMDVVDGAPAGIMMLDAAGRIAFANETAKNVLDLEDGSDGGVRGPGWVVRGDGSGEPDSLPALVRPEAFRGKEIRVDWPNGWFVKLRVSGRPLSDANDQLGGAVVMFERA